MARVTDERVARLDDSALALAVERIPGGERRDLGAAEDDLLLLVVAGDGTLALGREHALTPGTAALVLAGEQAELHPGGSGLTILRATVGAGAHRHAPLGARETVLRLDDAANGKASGARAFQVLFGPHNGSNRATLFAGFIPPGKAPWHYHLYDEIVWVPDGPGRLHVAGEVEELGPGSAFRLRPREVHIVENASSDRPMTIIGIFTPAGSPSAAYLTAEVADAYTISGS
jgi:quercetin dioxygenase-like cupin family protein